MKKVLSVILVLMLSLAMVAIAESAESPVEGETPDMVPSIVSIITDPTVDLIVDQSGVGEAKMQADRLQEMGAEEFFGADAAAAIGEGNFIALIPIALSGYDESMGDVAVTFNCENFEGLAAGQPITTLIGVPFSEIDYNWSAIDSMADGESNVEVTIPAATMAELQATGSGLAAFYG